MAVSTGGADWRDGATAEQVAAVEHLYRNHRSLPYISPERDLAAWLEEVELSSSKARAFAVSLMRPCRRTNRS